MKRKYLFIHFCLAFISSSRSAKTNRTSNTYKKKLFSDERREKFKYLLKIFHLVFGFIFYFCVERWWHGVRREQEEKNPLSFFHCLGAFPLRERLKASSNLTRLVKIYFESKKDTIFPLRRGFRNYFNA